MTIETTQRADPATVFRRAANHIPTGTSVITALDGETPYGMTAGSVAVASYDPPLVAFFAAQGSTTADVVLNTGRFGVNVLGRGGENIAYRFASRGEDKFVGLQRRDSYSGMPWLEEAMVWMDCEVESVFPAGDHTGVLGRVVDYDATSHRVQPLVYCKSRISPLNPGYGRHLPTEALGWWAEP